MTHERTVAGLGFGHVQRLCDLHKPLRLSPTIAWSADSAHVAVCGPDHRIFIW